MCDPERTFFTAAQYSLHMKDPYHVDVHKFHNETLELLINKISGVEVIILAIIRTITSEIRDNTPPRQYYCRYMFYSCQWIIKLNCGMAVLYQSLWIMIFAICSFQVTDEEKDID